MEDSIKMGKPSITELIKILEELKKKHGDILVTGAYDGYWNTDVEVQFCEGHLIIGSIT